MEKHFKITLNVLAILITINIILSTLVIFYDCKFRKPKTIMIEKEVITYKNMPNKYIGTFNFTHYCSCPKCTGKAKGSTPRTAVGHKPRQGRTIAVDPKKIPLHSIVYIETLGYFVAEDVGGGVKGNHIDIYVDNHEDAVKLGRLGGKKLKVYVLSNQLVKDSRK